MNSSNGIATINQPVTQGGVYAVKVVNLNVGPLKLTTTITPTVKSLAPTKVVKVQESGAEFLGAA